jgi:hypothetical protein
MRRDDEQAKYERWWLGKYCRVWSGDYYKKVVKIELCGPPSFVYGDVQLTFEDGRVVPVPHEEAFKPRKSDVEVQEER